ncbi:MAG TPA: dihydroneopterin aldolase [Thiopseudomonas sp.]|nr:dihydroneopterin aldolase [Thiopseudomonas sp.]
MDTVFIENLEVDTIIGAYDWERTIRQNLLVDLSMAWDNRPSAADDALHLALDYAAVAECVEQFAQHSSFELVETFAERLAALLIAEFKIPWLRLKVTKPGAVAKARGVGVEIERGCR